MDAIDLNGWVNRYRGAWNSAKTDQVLACFTDDLRYLDAETRGAVEGQEAMRRYCDKFFATWRIQYRVNYAHALADRSGFLVCWSAEIRPAQGEKSAQMRGVDVVFLRGEKIEQVESYYDRLAAAALMR
jgi:ketosteroid isomerase-like protein